MKLVAVEFERFACFERRFVPLQPGLNILVGKNNSGKTAILRGLSALDALPIEPVRGLGQELAEYAWKDTSPPYFSLHVWFEVENGDPQLFAGPEQPWRELVKKERPELVFSFRVWPRDNHVGIEGCRLTYGGKEFPILERIREGAGWAQVWYNIEGNRANSRALEVASARNGPDGQPSPIFRPQDLFHALAALKAPRMIDAHRVARPELALQTVTTLPPNAETLPQFLQTLQGTDRPRFAAIEKFVTSVFPEFEYVNPESAENRVFISLTLRKTGMKVRLTHCGTGVEQVLTLATFVLTSPPGSLILLDEPHAYLHPSAERELIAFLSAHDEHRYLISTHSAVLINAVGPERIIHLTAGETGARRSVAIVEMGGILNALGYRNSDFLFNDRLIFVEGDSDREIIPVFLERSGKLAPSPLARTGFPTTNGKGRAEGRRKQTSILFYEKLLEQLGRANLPRVYIFDGDCSPTDKTLLQRTRSRGTNERLKVRFLPRRELENYLLVPEAIAQAITDQARLVGTALPAPTTPKDVAAKLNALLGSDDKAIFPEGRVGDPLQTGKASIVLERIFSQYNLNYSKRESGLLIAHNITAGNQPALSELFELVREIF